MNDPTYELLVAVRNKLLATPSVSGVVTGIYDRVPGDQGANGVGSDAKSPYVSFGPTSSVPDDFDCVFGEEVTIQLDVWSWGAGLAYSSAECRSISSAIKRALHNVDLELSDNAIVTLEHNITRVMRDRDGITNHGVIQFSAVIETP